MYFLFTCSLLWTSFILTHFIVFCQLFFKRFLSFFQTYFFIFFKKNFYTLNLKFFIILNKYFSLFSVFFNVLFLSGTVLYFSTFELHCQHIFYFFKKYFFNFLCSFLLKYFLAFFDNIFFCFFLKIKFGLTQTMSYFSFIFSQKNKDILYYLGLICCFLSTTVLYFNTFICHCQH